MEPRLTEWQPFRENRFVQGILAFLALEVALAVWLAEENDPLWAAAIGYGVLALVATLLLVGGLRTEVHDDRLVVWMKGLRRRAVPWGEVVSAEAITIRPLRDYGGWGIRYGGKARGWIYNVRGTGAVRFMLQGGRVLVVGTQRPERLWMAVEEARRAAASETPKPPAD